MLDIGNRVVMVSGASRGLGLAVAHTLYAAGYRLSLGVRDPKSAGLREVPWDPERVFVHRFDAMITAAPRAWVDATMDRFGGIDALINNAATAKHVGIELGPAASEEEQEAIFDELLTVNVKAPLRLIRAALPALRQCGHGRVVNVASLSGKRLPGLAVGYPMTKFALVALTHGLRRLGWEDGIRATVLCPGFIRTAMSMSRATEVGMPAEKMATPEELASIIELLLRLPNTSSIAELLVNNRFEDML
jgi:NAD(P)-dependent dehydrogenase (short-subunit alcohol dehydrogenase family)